MAANSGSELVATTSSPPDIPPRNAATPPSKLFMSTSRPTSSKKPMSLATYGAMWTMLGGVTAPPKTSCIRSVGLVGGLVATGPGAVEPAAAAGFPAVGAAGAAAGAAVGAVVGAAAGAVVGAVVGAAGGELDDAQALSTKMSGTTSRKSEGFMARRLLSF